MTEIYWITRLDAICGFLTTTTMIGIAISTVLFAIAICNKGDANLYTEGEKQWNKSMKNYQILMRYFKRYTIVTLVLIVINIFMPTKNDALLIYGIGGTIDYIKSNDTAKQLPDKCIKALDKWVENLNEDNKQKEDNNESK